jgi:hypothetical protein
VGLGKGMGVYERRKHTLPSVAVLIFITEILKKLYYTGDSPIYISLYIFKYIEIKRGGLYPGKHDLV